MRQWEKKYETAALQKRFWTHIAAEIHSLIHSMKMESSFTTLIGSRNWHVYQKSTWKNPKKDKALSFKKETDPVVLRFDPFSIAFTRKSN